MKLFIARQPIFDAQQHVVGYELLFRSGDSNKYDGEDADQATVNVISGAFLLLGMDKLTDTKRAFINFTDNLLRQEIATLLPPQAVVIEILENVEPTDEMVDLCRKLKQLGYILALDDFIFSAKFRQLIDIVDIIKVDFLTTKGLSRKKIVDQVNTSRIKFLAEKVETRADFETAISLGYSLFQGYFFSKPEILSEQDIPSHKLHYLRILQELHGNEFDYDRLENVIKHDVAFSYKLLKFINSATFGFSTRIQSIRHALVILGKRQIVQWLSLLIMRELGRETLEEVVALSAIRAKMGELLAHKMNIAKQAEDCFIMGMFSFLDRLLNRSMKEILEELPISIDIKAALLGQPGVMRDMFCLIVAYEKGEWEEVSLYAERCNVKETDIPEIYFEAVQWAEKLMRSDRNE